MPDQNNQDNNAPQTRKIDEDVKKLREAVLGYIGEKVEEEKKNSIISRITNAVKPNTSNEKRQAAPPAAAKPVDKKDSKAILDAIGEQEQEDQPSGFTGFLKIPKKKPESALVKQKPPDGQTIKKGRQALAGIIEKKEDARQERPWKKTAEDISSKKPQILQSIQPQPSKMASIQAPLAAKVEAKLAKQKIPATQLKNTPDIKRSEADTKKVSFWQKHNRHFQIPNLSKDIREFERSLLRVLEIIILGLVVEACLYLCFVLVVLNFKVDNPVFRKINYWFPVPAVFSVEGIINYYEYKDSLARNAVSEDDEKKYDIFLNRIVLNRLLAEYGISKEQMNNQDFWQNLGKRVIADPAYNNEGLSRIRRIKQVVNEENFQQIGDKFGDERMEFSMTIDEASQLFGQDIASLGLGDISEIVHTDAGYSVFRVIFKSDRYIDLSRITVFADDIRDILHKKKQEVKIWTLVN